MFNLFKKKEKINKIKERIKVLNDKLWVILMTGRSFDIENRYRYCEGLDFYCEEYKIFSLNTALGRRKIAVNKDTLCYGCDDMIKQGSSSRWSFNIDYIFKIKIKNNKDVFLYPRPFTKMTKEEIDLAILEFEKAIDKVYNNIVKLNKTHADIVEFLEGSS